MTSMSNQMSFRMLRSGLTTVCLLAGLLILIADSAPVATSAASSSTFVLAVAILPVEDQPANPDGNQTPAATNATTNTAAATGNIKFKTDNILRLSNWLDWLALLACVIGMFVSASLWALGSKGQNPGQELTGKKGMILCCTAAFFVGALPGMLNWLEGAAHTADTTGVTGAGPGNPAASNNNIGSTGAIWCDPGSTIPACHQN